MQTITFLFKSLFVLLGILLGILVIGLGFLAIGWVFGQLFPLSQYEATIIALSTGAVLILLVSRFFQMMTMEIPEDEEAYEVEASPHPGKERTPKRRRSRR